MSRNSFVTVLVLYHKPLQLPQLHINALVLPLSTSEERLLDVKLMINLTANGVVFFDVTFGMN